MRKARTAFARFRSPNSRAVRHRPLATSTNAVAVDAHISNTIAERPKTTVQLPLPLATRNLLRAASDLAQRSIANPELWTTSAQDAVTDLREPRKPVVAFYGDVRSGARDIVTALLDDPLSDDQERRNALTGRHDAATHPPRPLSISYDDQSSGAENSLRLRAPWLETANVTVLEVPELDVSRSLPALFKADHVVLVTDNIRFLTQPHFASLVRAFAHHPSSQLLLNRVVTLTTSVHEDEAELGRQLNGLLCPEHTQTVDSGPPTIQVFTVSSTEALDAFDIFRNTQSSSRSSATRAANLEVYQRKSLASALSPLAARIATALSARVPISANDPCHTQSATAAFLVSRILQACETSLSTAHSELSHAQRRISPLRTKAAQDRMDLEASLTGVDLTGKVGADTSLAQEDDGANALSLVTEEMSRCESGARGVLQDQLSWWALLRGRVDDVGNVMSDVVIDDYGRELEKKVVFLSGRLASTQREFSSLSTELVSFPPSSPFHSPVLVNTVSQQQQRDGRMLSTTASPTLPASMANLLRPIDTRRDQILTQLIPQLHSRAQLLMFQLYLITATSTGSAWAGWISGSIEWMTGDVAVGLAALGVASGARWSVGRWEKAQRRFWQGWRRIGEGLSRDIKGSLEDTFNESVLRTQKVACDGLQELIDLRRKSIEQLQSEHDHIADKLGSLLAQR